MRFVCPADFREMMKFIYLGNNAAMPVYHDKLGRSLTNGAQLASKIMASKMGFLRWLSSLGVFRQDHSTHHHGDMKQFVEKLPVSTYEDIVDFTFVSGHS